MINQIFRSFDTSITNIADGNHEETRFKLDISKSNAEALDRQGKGSKEARGVIDKPQSQFIAPQERGIIDRVGKASDEKRTHPTENIAKEYSEKS